MEFPNGVSVIICAFNAANRITPTLRHLAVQNAPGVSWEVIVVDNASEDETSKVAHEAWVGVTAASLQVLREPKRGYNHAVELGISRSRFNILAHVHDDNWVAEDWIARVANIFQNMPDTGACGGRINAACEIEPPGWFADFAPYYAVGRQAEQSCDVTWTRGFLWGAGLCVRRAALENMRRAGFRLLTSGRSSGKRLISGEDSELCHALRLAGWKLWYDDNLCLTHYLPAARLNWKYLRRLVRSYGESSVAHDCYLDKHPSTWVWWNELLKAGWELIKENQFLMDFFSDDKKSLDILETEMKMGRFFELIRQHRNYKKRIEALSRAAWRKNLT